MIIIKKCLEVFLILPLPLPNNQKEMACDHGGRSANPDFEKSGEFVILGEKGLIRLLFSEVSLVSKKMHKELQKRKGYRTTGALGTERAKCKLVG